MQSALLSLESSANQAKYLIVQPKSSKSSALALQGIQGLNAIGSTYRAEPGISVCSGSRWFSCRMQKLSSSLEPGRPRGRRLTQPKERKMSYNARYAPEMRPLPLLIDAIEVISGAVPRRTTRPVRSNVLGMGGEVSAPLTSRLLEL